MTKSKIQSSKALNQNFEDLCQWKSEKKKSLVKNRKVQNFIFVALVLLPLSNKGWLFHLAEDNIFLLTK